MALPRPCIALGRPRLLTALLLCLVTLACTSRNYGYLMRDPAVTSQFESYQVSPNYRYFATGPLSAPNAILGVRQGYPFIEGLWQEIDLTSPRLQGMIEMLRTLDPDNLTAKYYGSKIFTPGGEQVGIWYSKWDWTTVILTNDKQLEIYTPTPILIFRPDHFSRPSKE